ncbi:MAG: translocation/assembly module TamB domain-containing protein [Desulfobacterales bacterium]
MKKTSPEEAPPTDTSRRRRLLKRLLKVVSAILLVLVALGVLATLVLQIPAVQTRAKALAIETLERQTGLRLELGSLSGSLLTNLSATDLRLEGPSGPLLAVDRISVGYALPLLLHRTLMIRYLRFEGLQVYLVRQADGTWNVEAEARRFASPAGEPSEGAPLAVVFRRLAIDGGTLSIRDEASAPPQIRRIENLTLDLQLDIASEIKADLRKLAFSLDQPRIVVAGLEGRLRYDLEQSALHVEGLTLKTDASALAIDAAIEFKQPEPEIRAAVQIDTLDLAEVGRVLDTDALTTGEITGRIDLQGTPRQLHHRLKLVFDQRQSLAAEGELALTGDRAVALETSGSLTDIDPATWPFIDAPHLEGDIDADFSVSARHVDGPQRQVHLKVQVAASRLAGFEVENGDFDLTLENGDLTVTTAALAGPTGRLRLQGRVAGIETGAPFDDIALAGEVRDLDPSAFLADPRWAGRVNADVKVAAKPKAAAGAAGDMADWTAEADVTLSPSVLFGTSITRAQARATWDGALVRLTSFELDSGLAQAALTGQAAARDRSYRIDGRLDFPELQRLEPLLTRLVPDLPAAQVPAGTLRITGWVDGSPRRTDVKARVTGDNVALEPIEVAALDVDGTFRLAGASLSGKATGRFSDIYYQGHRFPRLDLSVDLKPEQLGVDLSLAHAAGEHLTLKGTVGQWRRAERRVDIETLQVTGIAAPFDRLAAEIRNTAPIRLRTDPKGVDVDSLKLAAGEASLAAEGRLAREGPQHFRFSVARLSLESLESLWQDESTLKGNLSAEMNLKGTAVDPVIDATVAARDVSGYDVSLAEIDLKLGYRDDAASLTATALKKNSRLFELTARSGLALRLLPFEFTPEPGSLQARLEAEDLILSELPLPAQREVKLEGRVSVHLQAAGDLRQPQLTGSLNLRDGSLALPRHGLTYETLQADLRLVPGKLTIEQLLVNGDDEGRLSLSGQVLLDGLTPADLDLHLTGQRAAVAWNREFTARIEPDMSLTGSLSAPSVSGSIRILEGRINLDRLAAGGPADIVVLGEQTADGRAIVIGERGESPLAPLAADVTVEIPRNVWLRGQGLNAEIAGAIRLQKKRQAPFLLTGSLNTVRGTYEFQGRRFTIARGVVEFQGLPEPDPRLDIQAENRIGNVTIIVRIGGSVRHIELSLDSDPAMDQADIVSYLIFGRPTNELRSQQATSAEAAALGLAGNLAARQLNAVLGDTLKLDTLSISPGEEGWGSGSLSVGKYVARNIFVTYRYEFSGRTFGEMEIEYQLNRNFSIAAQVGNERSSGVDLIWKLDF